MTIRRRAAWTGFAILALGIAGCGSPGRPVPAGPFTLLRYRRTLPAGSRVRPGDVEPVRCRSLDLPGLGGYPRRVEELRGSAVTSRRDPGTLVHDGHLELGALSPEPAAVQLAEGELGLVTVLSPRLDAAPGVRLELPLPRRPEVRTRSRRRLAPDPRDTSPVSLSVALAGTRTRDGTGILLVGVPTEVRRLVAGEPPRPLEGEVVGKLPRRPLESPGEASVVLGTEQTREVLVARRALREGEILDPAGLAVVPMEAHLIPGDALVSIPEAAGSRTRSPLHAGEILRRPVLAEAAPLAEPVELQFEGLDPDWVHPGSDALLLRWGSRDPPLPIRVTDVLRNAPGNPARLVVRPRVGFDWPSSRPNRPGEGGSRPWALLLER